MFEVGEVQLKAPVFLAPMSGVTDAPFRTQASRFAAPAVVTEMVAGAELARETEEFVRRAAPHTGSGPFIVQLAGRDPAWMRAGAALAEAAGADIIDINMGCPAKKVTGGQSGCALMREPDLARSLIAATVKAVCVPVTIKMRLGWDEASLNAPELARIAEGEGARMITVHGRTRNQFYAGKADWRGIAATVAATSLPVLANGDIEDEVSARQALALSGAAGVMIGRGAVGRPWRAAQIANALYGTPYVAPTPAEKLGSLIDQISDSVGLYGERLGVRVVRKHVAAFVDAWAQDFALPPMADLRVRLCRLDSADVLIEQISQAFAEHRHPLGAVA